MVRYNATSDTYELVAGGVALCHSPDLATVAALLRGERFETGFIRRVLDPSAPADEAALLDADIREQARRTREYNTSTARYAEREAEERARARARFTPKTAPSPDLSLDDLF